MSGTSANPLESMGDNINPGISLMAKPPASSGLMANANPLELAQGVQQLQRTTNENTMWRQNFMARQKAGQIIASSPNSEGAIQGLMSDPDVAPFAGEIIGQLRSANQALVQTQGLQATQARDALGALVKAGATAMNDPSQLEKQAIIQLRALPPDIQKTALPLFKDWISSMKEGLPSDPAQAKQVYQSRLSGALVSSGVDADTINKMFYGTPVDRDLGGTHVFGVQTPASQGGGLKLGSALPNSVAPQPLKITTPEGGEQSVLLGPLGTTTPLAPSGPDTATSGLMKGQGEAAGEITKELSANAANVPTALNRVDMLQDLLQHTIAGGGVR